MTDNTIGGSTPASTAERLINVSGTEPASFRYGNPGAQYPSVDAARFGQIGYGIIGGGHKIAAFPSPVNGAAANFDLLYRKYAGMTIGAAGTKWTGAHGFGIPGYDSGAVLTKNMLEEPTTAIDLMKAIAGRESGRGTNLTEQQWRQAHMMFKAGSADAFIRQNPPDITRPSSPGVPSGAGMLRRAREHIGQKYRNIQVPKDDPDWAGPWDCAEFVSWLVYQEAGILYGCTDNSAEPAKADAYTGAWKADAERRGKRVSVDEAAGTVGGIVLRYPPPSGGMGHIAICDGKGGTVEAKGERYGVIADSVNGRLWDIGILVPGISYDQEAPISVQPPASVYARGAPNMNKAIVANIQRALGFSGVAVDGDFGEETERAVVRFQEQQGLTVDGEVGPETADALGVSLTDPGIVPAGPVDEPPMWEPPPLELPTTSTEFKLPPVGNWLNVMRYSMQLMTILKGFDVQAITIEEYLRRAIVFLQPTDSARIIEGRAALEELPPPLPQPQPTKPKESRMFGANWKTTLGGIATLLTGIAGILTTVTQTRSFDLNAIMQLIMSLGLGAGGAGLIAAKDKDVTGGTVSNDVRNPAAENLGTSSRPRI